MTVSVVNEYSAEKDRANSLGPYSLGFTPTAGNTLLYVIFQRNGGTFSTPAGWTLVGQNAGASGFDDTVVAFTKASEGTETTIAVPSSTGGNSGSDGNRLLVLELAGVTANVADSATTTGGPGTSLTSGPVTAQIGDAVFALWAQQGDASRTWTPGTGYTDQESGSLAGGYHPGYLCEWREASADTDYSPDATSSVNSTWRSLAFALGGVPAVVTPKVSVSVNSVTLDNPLGVEVRVELNGTGAGSMAIRRGDPQATEATLAQGSLVSVTIPEIDPDPIFEFFLEEGDFDLISSDEEGGEELRFGGRGSLAYLDRARMLAGEYAGLTFGHPEPGKGVWLFGEDATEGQILAKVIAEAQDPDRPWDPIPDLVVTFTEDDDTDGEAWADTTFEGIYRIPIGASVLDEVLRLAHGGLLSVEMAPGLVLNAYRDRGVDRSSATFAAGKVRFVKGVNIATELVRGMAGRSFANRALVKYGEGKYTNTSVAGTFPYDRETFLEVTTDSPVTAQRLAQGLLGWRVGAQESLVLSHTVPWPGEAPDDATGLYLPGPAWTDNGRYWVGDLVTLHTGSDEFDYANATQRVYAITLRADETGYLAPPIVELNGPYSDGTDDGLDAAAGAGSGSSSGGGGSTVVPTLEEVLAAGAQDSGSSLGTDGQVLTTHGDGTATWEGLPGQWKQPVRVATTASVTIATALNNGDTLDGVTLATGDRVLVKDQSTASQNGIYIVGTTPTRAADLDEDGEVLGSLVYVIAGTANGGKAFRCTNTGATVVDTDAINWAEFGGGGSLALDDLTDVDTTGVADGDVLTYDSGTSEWVPVAPTSGSGDTSGQFIVGFDGGGEALTAGAQQDIVAPFTGTITGWTLLADQTGSAVVDIWNDTYGNYPPTDADTITASAPPTLSSAAKATSSTLTGWDTAVTAGDVLRFNLDSASSAERLLLVVGYSRP